MHWLSTKRAKAIMIAPSLLIYIVKNTLPERYDDFLEDLQEIFTEIEKNDDDFMFDEINATYKLSKLEKVE